MRRFFTRENLYLILLHASRARRLSSITRSEYFWLSRLEETTLHLIDEFYPFSHNPLFYPPKGGDFPMTDAEISAYLAHTRGNNSRLLAAMDLQHPMRAAFAELGDRLTGIEDSWAQYLHTITPH